MTSTSKACREIIQIAEREGVTSPVVVGGDPHSRIVGKVGSAQICVVVSLTKAVATRCNKACTKLNIRRAVRAAQAGRSA